MSGKILVVVYVPLLEKKFDVYIPILKKIGTVKSLIISIVEENSDGIFVDDGNKNLYDKITGEILDDNLFVKNSNLTNGSKIILY